MLYPNFNNQTSFSTNHLEPGMHIAPSSNVRKKMMDEFNVPLVRAVGASPKVNMDESHAEIVNSAQDGSPAVEWFDQLPFGRLPGWNRLPVIDLFNQPHSLAELATYGQRLAEEQQVEV